MALLIVCIAAAARGEQTRPTTGPAEQNRVQFASEKFGFRLRFPDSLRKVDPARGERRDRGGVALWLVRPESDHRGTQAFIQVASPPDIRGGLSLAESAATYLETLKRTMSDAKVLESADTTLGGSPAKRFLVQGHQVQDGRARKLHVVVAQHDDRFFTVLCSAEPQSYDLLKQICDQVVESFQWTK